MDVSAWTHFDRRSVLRWAVSFAIAALLSIGMVSTAHALAPASGEVIVGFDDGSSSLERRSAIEDVGATLTDRLGGTSGAVLKLNPGDSPDQVAAELMDAPGVAFAEPNFAIKATATVNDTYFADGQLWGLLAISADRAWDGVAGSGVTVAVIDTGAEMTHPDLQGQFWQNPRDPANGVDDDGNGIVDDTNGADLLRNDGTPDDENNHGTHVTGTIAAAANNGIGVAGVAPGARIMELKVLDQAGSGNVADAIKAIDFAVGHGANVINLSWSGPDPSEALRLALERASNAGVTIAAAAGNSNQDIGQTPAYPASFELPNLISVAATDDTRGIAGFSNYGSGVDVAAPGAGIVSTVRGGYGAYNGTSMAAPHVAGALALTKSARPDASAAEIVSATIGTTRALTNPTSKPITNGEINAVAAVERIRNAPLASPAPAAAEEAPALGDLIAPSFFRLRALGTRGKVFSGGRVKISWTLATDNVALAGYKVYVDGKSRIFVGDPDGVDGPRRAATTTKLRMAAGRHRVRVTAIDASGNKTVASARGGSKNAMVAVIRRARK